VKNIPNKTSKSGSKVSAKTAKSVDVDLVPRAKKIDDKEAKEVLGGVKQTSAQVVADL
jgi:hypothetical protein